MLEVSKAGARVFRNNCGLALMADGSHIKYGVANPGGSDLIGWTPVTITPGMVGQTIAVFVAMEVKTERGRASQAQLKFIDAVNNNGGIAGIVRSPEDGVALINEG